MSTLLYLSALRRDHRAVTALEYGLIAAAVVAIGLAGFSLIGGDLANMFTSVNNAMEDHRHVMPGLDAMMPASPRRSSWALASWSC